jgi:hypothetical protein
MFQPGRRGMMRKIDREGGWMGWVRLCGAAFVLAVVLMSRPGEAIAREACAPYVSGGIDSPASGTLLGTMTVQECASINGGFSGTGAGYEQCRTYEVGYYDMGSYTLELDCRDYTLF